MPVLDALGRAYAAQGLVVLAINVGESEKRYQEYVRAAGHQHLRWARDGDGETVRAYRVRGIPVSYLLDQEGVVRFVHVGYSSRLEGALTREVESLLE